MNKILNYSFEKKKINKDEILKLINLYEDENYFELIDCCLSKNSKKVIRIINSKNFNNNDSIILLRSLLARVKRLIDLKKLQKKNGDKKQTIDNFKPPIFWKDKEIVENQIDLWSTKQIYELLEQVNELEINLKRNGNLSSNIVFDLILNTSSN